MALTEQEVNAVRESWKTLTSGGMEIVGVVILQGLFNKAPDTRKLFTGVGIEENMPATLTVAELCAIEKLKSHALKLAETIDLVVANLTNVDLVVKSCTDLGEAHIHFDVKPNHVDILGPILLDVIAENLKIKPPNFVIDSWAKAYGVIATCFKKGLSF